MLFVFVMIVFVCVHFVYYVYAYMLKCMLWLFELYVYVYVLVFALHEELSGVCWLRGGRVGLPGLPYLLLSISLPVVCSNP